ncbi:MAG: M28 family metallopeptidase [Thermoplasmatota archaeon]
MKRPFGLTILLLAGLFAGCLSDEAGSDENAVPAVDPDALVIPELDAVALLAGLRDFAETFPERADNLPAHTGARDWIAAEMEALGLDVWRHEFENGIPQENIVGIQWGADREQVVVVGGHYDIASKECGLLGTCVLRPFSQGAYDDASGILLILHLAAAFADMELPFSVAFVAFDGEERGLQGSGAFSEALIDGTTPFGPLEPTAIRAMLNLDMFGINWPGTDAPVYFDSNSPELEAHVGKVRDAIAMPEEMLEYRGISLGRSDYHWFFELGVPTGFFISSFEEWQLPADVPYNVQALALPGGISAYPFWHLEDTYDTMVLMAGSQADLEAAFQAAADLAAGTLYRMAVDTAPLTAPEA